MKNTIAYLFFALCLSACELDYFPSDALTSEQLGANPASGVYSTDGNYSMFKDILEYKGIGYSANTYIRHYFQMAEFRGDNVCLSGKTTDPLYNELCYNDLATDNSNYYMWWVAYHVCYGTNAIIEKLPQGTSDYYDHILGENYFLRAIAHLHLVTLFATPYTAGVDKPGIVLRTSTNTSETKRSTVGQVYDQIRDDLILAAELMKNDKSREKNKGYASREAALGLLSRVYLYRGENDEVIKTVDELLNGADPASKLDPNLKTYFSNALTSEETLWCVAQIDPSPLEEGGENPQRSAIGSMYYTAGKPGDDSGWCEMFYSDPLYKLLSRYPEDIRFKDFCIPLLTNTDVNPNDKQCHWPVDEGDLYRANEVRNLILDPSNNQYYFEENGQKIYVQKEMIDGYPSYYINLDNTKVNVMFYNRVDHRYTFPIFMCPKFSNIEGDIANVQMTSPVMLRWAEVILNRAEAYAKTGQDNLALDDVNVIRERAGLANDALFSISNYKQHGYQSTLEVVLDERRIELCFEGHRALDVFRNNLTMDRRFPGVQTWEEVSPNDPRIPYKIPFDETSTSGI